jgi:hypothetical protein
MGAATVSSNFSAEAFRVSPFPQLLEWSSPFNGRQVSVPACAVSATIQWATYSGCTSGHTIKPSSISCPYEAG